VCGPGEKEILWPVNWAEPHCNPPVDQNASFNREEREPVTAPAGRVYPMLGRHQSLSAGIAYGHYKTDLRLLIRHASELLEIAKEDSGRRSVAFGYFSRNGEKLRFAMPWSEDAAKAPEAQRWMTAVTKAFRKGALPGRLPYKLRQLTDAALAEPAASGGQRNLPSEEWLRALLATAFEQGAGGRAIESALVKIWRAGFQSDPDCAADGLLLCRALARSGESGGEL
jgi:hypothetical protein